MSALNKKLGRDLWRLKGQVGTIAIVLACGIMAMLMLRSAWQSLLVARDDYYATHRFGDVFARATRVPDAIAARLERIPGVAGVYPRIMRDVMLPMAEMPEPIPGRIVSVPDDGDPPLNALHLRAGRMPSRGADEAAVLEQFVTAHRLALGDQIPVVIEGELRRIQIVGIALSPEYVLAMSPGEMMPDKKRFAVLWMARGAVASAFRMEGAFDDVVLQLEPGAEAASVLVEVDRELAPYGGFHAIGRDKQSSNFSLASELEQLRTIALVVPTVFLLVAAFLVNVVISRLVFLERTQIAVLKALGFTDVRIALHYLGLVSLVVAIAAVVGVAAGTQAARWMTDLYADFYRFPTHLYKIDAVLVAATIGIALGAAVIGALGSVRRVTQMQPAEAMRPPAPLGYRRSLLERVSIGKLVGASTMMVVREIERRPVRFVMSALGIAMGVAIFLFGRFSWDSFEHLMDETYMREHREDLTVALRRARPASATTELARIPGVRLAEPQRMVPARITLGSRYRDTVIVGLPAEPALRVLLDHGVQPVDVPPQGMLVSGELARRLAIRPGDRLEVEIMEGDWRTRTLEVAGLIEESFGMMVYAHDRWLAGVLGEEPRVTTALLAVDPDRLDDVRTRLKALPEVLSSTTTMQVRQAFTDQAGQSMLFFTIVLTISAAAISVGVVYNNARIALSLRSRDLASLRVLGFTRPEISAILLGEIAAQVAVGIPLGLAIGRYGADAMAAAMASEWVRFPVFIDPATYATASLIALLAGLTSALLVRGKLDCLDLIGVLKASE
ncbi:MAG: ABC transporter permease [Kofleriaceae bacterium]|nr:ABC transporter permease [Kofleriaceae bacterium]